jgi:hypothetical protein
MFGKCGKCEALKEHNAYLKKIIDSLLQHVGADKVLGDNSLAEQIPVVLEDEQGSEDPSTTFGE